MRRYGGGRKSMKEKIENRDNKMTHHENPNINAKEKVYEEKKRRDLRRN